MLNEEILRELRQALLDYDQEATEKATMKALNKGISTHEVQNVLMDTIREIGEKFHKLEVYLVELIMATDALNAGMAVLEAKLLEEREEIPKMGTIVIGTVKGDQHDIGKNIVSTMLTAAGFKVIDLGVDVSNKAFAKAVETYKPAIVGLSSLMSTTRPMQKDVIDYFEAVSIRKNCRIMVGGAIVTKAFAEEIGADGYGVDATKAVEVAKKLVAK
ncbi:MAG: cobalamin-dependent protein [Candidatus Bathyarchaeota archaeon]|nr:MAG: cobalamin-dependent protein [Candidatus Bathyarchaeota archaeon]